MNKETQKKEPEHRENLKNVSYAIWKNTDKNGREFKTVTLSKGYLKNPDDKQNTYMKVQLNEDELGRAIVALKRARRLLEGS